MSTEAWKEEHRAMTCCVCGERGPGVIGDERSAQLAAKAGGWWIKQMQARQKIAKLEGSCSVQQLGSYGASHHIGYEEKRDFDYRGICPTCAGYVRSEVAS